MRFLLGSVIGLVAISGSVTPVAAQINVERFARSNFNFSPPGARSMGVGGAFTAIADDATAVESNPAGLTTLLEPEVSFEMKIANAETTVAREAGGGANGRTFNNGSMFPSFVSVAVPVSAGRATLAASYARIVNSTGDLAGNGFAQPDGGYTYPWISEMEYRVSNLGLGAGMKLGSVISVGVSAGVSRLAMDMEHTRYNVNFNAPGFQANRVEVADASGTSPFANVGLLADMGGVKAGITYKKRPEFSDLPVLFWGPRNVPIEGEYDRTFSIRLPDAIGAGLAFKPSTNFTVSLAAEQVMYSQMAEDIAILVSFSDTAVTADRYQADDGMDLRAGAEWTTLRGTTPLAVRVGAARLAASNVYYTGTSATQRGLWGAEPGEGSTEISGGVGGVLFGRVQVDLAGVIGDTRREFITSIVLRR